MATQSAMLANWPLRFAAHVSFIFLSYFLFLQPHLVGCLAYRHQTLPHFLMVINFEAPMPKILRPKHQNSAIFQTAL